MTPERIEAFCLSLPGTTLGVQWGAERVFKVGGKMFAILRERGGIAFKCSDVAFEMLPNRAGIVPAPYLARARWVALERLDAMEEEDLLDYLRMAYGLILAKLPRTERERLTEALRSPPGLH